MRIIMLNILVTILLLVATNAHSKTVKYNFDIDNKIVNITGEDVKAIAINNQIPGPTIKATVGDILQVTFNNKMDHETSIHWHGVLLPNDQDGVPYLNTPPIPPHSSFTYKYKITHPGTYWYHSHTGLQEQSGMYGALVFYPKGRNAIKTSQDNVVVLSDWTNENPNQVQANIKKDGDYYALKKDSVQSWLKVLQHGSKAVENRVNASLSRMGPMDLSDIGYDAFLANGKQESQIKANPGESIRIRLVNAATSSYFVVEFAGLPMTIVSADGVDVEPLKVKKFRMATAETYDIIVRIPDNKSYELRATSEDITGHSSIFVGNGKKVFSPNLPKPNPFIMDHSMPNHNMKKMKMKGMNHKMPATSHAQMGHTGHKIKKTKPVKVVEFMNNYKHLRALNDTDFPKNKKRREVILNLTGNMERYVWSFNNKTLRDSEKIMIKKGEIVRFKLINKTMMNHPIHLHGHFYRLLNGQGNKSPLKHTVNVAPLETVTFEFDANEEKDWFFHCHNLYHAKTGMARVVSYEDTTTATQETLDLLDGDGWFFKTELAALSNFTTGMFRASDSYNALELEYNYNYKRKYEAELTYARSLTRLLDIYAGADFAREDEDTKSEVKGVFGFKYVLPLLIESNLSIDTKGKVKLELGSELQLTDRGKFEWSYDTNKDYRLSLSYEINKAFLLFTAYDSQYKWGAGLQLKF